MRWSEIGEVSCSVARALSVVGDRWTILLLRSAFLGIRRFEDFQSATGASRALVAERLKHLVDEGVLERVAYQERPERFEYRLTPKGLDLYPVITSLLAWGDQWMPLPDGPPVTLVHKPCGHEFHPVQVCPHCGEAAGPRSVRATVTTRDDAAAG